MAHIHPVIDTDVHYKIDGITRTVSNVDETKRELVQGDHNSERFTFEIPRYVDGHDFSECDLVEIHYANLDKLGKVRASDVYIVDDLQISEDDDQVVLLSWLISANATQFVGTLNFSIRFACTDGGTVTYAWNTTIFKGITILEALNNSEVAEDIEPDVIASMREAIISELEIPATTKIVPFLLTTISGQTYCLTNVPFAEVYQAYKDGATIVATSGSSTYTATSPCYRLDTITEASATFVRAYSNSGKAVLDTITFAADNSASFARVDVSGSGGGASWPVPEKVTAQTRITEAGYYYAHAGFAGIGVPTYIFSPFYCDPTKATTSATIASVYAGSHARLNVSKDGEITLQLASFVVSGTTVVTSYTNASAGMYEVHLAKLS